MRGSAPSPEMSTALPTSQAADAAEPRLDLRRECDDDPSQPLAEALDRALNYALSRVTLGLSPAALAEAYFDWMVHVAVAPGKQLQLTQKALRKTLRWHYVATCALQERPGGICVEPLPNDKRFSADAWRAWPFNAIHQAFLLQQQWWHDATTGVRGVTPQHERQLEFATRQILDVFSPANFVLSNPEVLRKTPAEAGQNLARGFWNFVEDWARTLNGRKPVGAETFKVGENLGLTLEAVRSVIPDAQVHGVGHCLGGTLLAIAAAGGAVRSAGAPSDRRRFQVRAAGRCVRHVHPRTVGF